VVVTLVTVVELVDYGVGLATQQTARKITTGIFLSIRIEWHPNGFIVFRLDEAQDGTFTGSHRVHIWPGKIVRRALPRHPTIHSHDGEMQYQGSPGRFLCPGISTPQWILNGRRKWSERTIPRSSPWVQSSLYPIDGVP